MDVKILVDEQRWEELQEVLRGPTGTLVAQETVDEQRGWRLLHLLASIGSTPPFLIDLVASLQPNVIFEPDRRYHDTPLHIVARNSQTTASKVVSLLQKLPNKQTVALRNIFGGTALHSAANHNAVIEVLRALVEAYPPVLRVTTYEGMHAVTALWTAYIQTIPGCTCVARILSGHEVSFAHFDRFWSKVQYLAVEYFRQSPHCPENGIPYPQFTIHGLLHCNVPINFYILALKRRPELAQFADRDGNLPLHVLIQNRPFRLKERESILATLEAYPTACIMKNNDGLVPLFMAIRNKIPWENGIEELVQAAPNTLDAREPATGLLPFQRAAHVGGNVAVATTYYLLTTRPDLCNA